ncbi:MAG: cation:proton antiporter [bacterium]|nr:cation:proton antiporter [bacterium]
MDNSFLQIGTILVLATTFGLGVRLLKQPLILAYILTGMSFGAMGLLGAASGETLSLLSTFGITFLLFMVGLELRLEDLKQVGKPVLFIGFGQVILTFIASLILSLILGFDSLASVYISLALTFSSTIITVKLLSDRRDLSSLYGRISVSILLVQDFVAIFILMFLSSTKAGVAFNPITFLLVFVKILALFLVISLLIKRAIPFLFRVLAQNQELLFLAAVTWCFLFASVSLLLGFSLEIGAFLAGVSLSSLPYHYQISSRIRPLRDLFVTLFFVALGMRMVLASGLDFLFSAIALSVFVLLVKPLIVMFLMGRAGFRKRTGFLTSITLAQISEFSLILVTIGQGLGHLGKGEASVIVGVGILTITTSNYLVMASQRIFHRIGDYLSIFEIANLHERRPKLEKKLENHTILVGCNRTGTDILELLKKKEGPYLVLDFDPEIIRTLEAQNIPCLFGDITDEEIIEQINLEKAKLIISTVPSLEDNLVLVSSAKLKNSEGVVIVTANFPDEADELYRAGADYVILPQLLGGKHIAHLLGEHTDNLEEYLYSKRKK